MDDIRPGRFFIMNPTADRKDYTPIIYTDYARCLLPFTIKS